jgi:hypothetical protein
VAVGDRIAADSVGSLVIRFLDDRVRGRFGGCLSNARTRYQPRKPRGFRWFSRVCFFAWGPVMMGRPPRAPVDLQAVTRDVKARVRRVIGELEAIEQQQDPIFASPRDVFLQLVLSIHELEAAAAKMRKAWWAPP